MTPTTARMTIAQMVLNQLFASIMPKFVAEFMNLIHLAVVLLVAILDVQVLVVPVPTRALEVQTWTL